MSDEKQDNLIHGFEIHGNHDHALNFLKDHRKMSSKQLEQLVRIAKTGKSAHFRAYDDNHYQDYKLVNEGGKLRIHSSSIH